VDSRDVDSRDGGLYSGCRAGSISRPGVVYMGCSRGVGGDTGVVYTGWAFLGCDLGNWNDGCE
jgi:hypothetical protein